MRKLTTGILITNNLVEKKTVDDNVILYIPAWFAFLAQTERLQIHYIAPESPLTHAPLVTTFLRNPHNYTYINASPDPPRQRITIPKWYPSG